MPTIVDIHALQTIPPSLINRDDTGAAKTAIFGGVPRQRVSSQSWKRAIRKDFEKNFDPNSVGFRTKSVVHEIAAEVVEKGGDSWEIERATKEAASLLKKAEIKIAKTTKKTRDETKVDLEQTEYLLFVSPRQIANAAQEIIRANGEAIKKQKAREILNSEPSIDIGLFGRMVATGDSMLDVDAACQVAHAISVHEAEPEFDFFAAVDDVVEDNDEVGAGMMGTVQMMSSTLYRFATIDVDSLQENLGDVEAAHAAVEAFVKSFITSMPTGKQNSFANNTLPELVFVAVRDNRSISLVNAFEEAVKSETGIGRRQASAQALAREARNIENEYGFTPQAAFVIGLGDLTEPFSDLAEKTTLPALAAKVRDAISEVQ